MVRVLTRFVIADFDVVAELRNCFDRSIRSCANEGMLNRWYRRLLSIRAFLTVVRDPDRTDQIFVVITDPAILNKSTFEIVTRRLRSSSKSSLMLDSRFAGQWSLEELLELPKNSLGHVYAKHMRDNNLDINFYPPVPGETIEAYIQARMRQTHDIWHIMTGFDTSVPGEIGLQAFTQAQLHAKSPTMIMVMFLLHCALFKPSILFDATRALARGWMMGERATALFGERFEDNWSRDLTEYRRDLGLTDFDDEHSNFALAHVMSKSPRTLERELPISL